MKKTENLKIEDSFGGYCDLLDVIDGLNLCAVSHNALVDAIDNYAKNVDEDGYIRGAKECPVITESVDGVVTGVWNEGK